MARFGLHRSTRAGRQNELDYDELVNALALLEEAGGDVGGEVMPVIAEMLVSATLDVFEHEGAVAGKPKWPELAESTLRKRAKRQPSGVFKILQDTGVLVSSITPVVTEQNVAEAFTNVPYAGYHISAEPRKVIPLRDFTDIDFDTVQADATDVILAQLIDTFAA